MHARLHGGLRTGGPISQNETPCAHEKHAAIPSSTLFQWASPLALEAYILWDSLAVTGREPGR